MGRATLLLEEPLFHLLKKQGRVNEGFRLKVILYGYFYLLCMQ